LCQSTRGDYWLRRLRIADEEQTKHTVACDAMNNALLALRQTTGIPYLFVISEVLFDGSGERLSIATSINLADHLSAVGPEALVFP